MPHIKRAGRKLGLGLAQNPNVELSLSIMFWRDCSMLMRDIESMIRICATHPVRGTNPGKSSLFSPSASAVPRVTASLIKMSSHLLHHLLAHV
jgi:hypothetical protein